MTSDPLEAARARMAAAFKILIYCDDPTHAGRRVPVTNFIATPDGGWHERPPSRARGVDKTSAGHHLIGDSAAESGWANDPTVSNADVRGRFKLACRKCKGTDGQGPVDARQETLFPILDGWHASGVLEVPLAEVAATISKKSN